MCCHSGTAGASTRSGSSTLTAATRSSAAASLRSNAAAEERVAAVNVDDPDLVEAPAVPEWQHIADYLDGRKVATITAGDLSVVSIDDPALQHELNREPGVRAVLDTETARQALLPQKQSRVALSLIHISEPT